MFTVLEINTTAYGTQYVVISEDGKMAELPCKFLKHLGLIGKSPYTQRGYAYALRFFSEYLESIHLDYQDVSMRHLSGFLDWLHNPVSGGKIVELSQIETIRSPRTINTYMAAIMSFYRYLFAVGYTQTDFDKKYLHIPAYGGTSPAYKDFLYHTHKGEQPARSIFHVRESKKQLAVLHPQQIHALINATTNIRDRFLIYLLFVSGLRIGEMLSLYNEDIIYDLKNGHRIQLTDRGLLPNGGKLKTGPRIVYVNQKCLDLYDDYQYEMLDQVAKNSDSLFVKVSGPNAGAPMNYNDVMSLFRRLQKKTGFVVHPHLLRHTHATMFYAKTKDAKALQERLGHRDIQTTLNIYVHPTSEEILRDWSAAAPAFEIEVR